MRRTIIIPAALLVAALSLAGCSAGFSPAESQSSDGGTVNNGYEAAPEAGGESIVDRAVIVTGDLTLTVDAPADAAREAVRIAEASGGRVDARNEYAPADGDKGRASLTLRLPSDSLTETLDKLKKLGEVETLEMSSDDVTTEVEDLDARTSALAASISRLHALLRTAKDTGDLIELETAITERQSELESMQSQQRYLADQVSLSTISVSFISTADAPVDKPETFLSGLEAGWLAFIAFGSGVLVILGLLLPWIVFFGIIAAAVVFILRRRKRTVAPDDYPAPPAPAPAD